MKMKGYTQMKMLEKWLKRPIDTKKVQPLLQSNNKRLSSKGERRSLSTRIVMQYRVAKGYMQ
jgi:hypothetical protein